MWPHEDSPIGVGLTMIRRGFAHLSLIEPSSHTARLDWGQDQRDSLDL